MSESEVELRWITTSETGILEQIANDPNYEWQHSQEYFAELTHLGHALVAFIGEVPVGYLLYQVIWGNTPFLSQIWLKDSQQGVGLGKRMVAELEERLLTDGYEHLTTSNETKNDAGRGFVQKLGFEEIGTLEMGHGPEVFSIKKLK